MTYSEKLKDQRWQKKRLELLEAANWQCQCPFCLNPKEKPTLHVHHRVYLRGKDPWDYPASAYDVLCDECHVKEQERMELAHIAVSAIDDLMSVCSILAKKPEPLGRRAASFFLRILSSEDTQITNAIKALEAVLDLSDTEFTRGYECGNRPKDQA